MELTGLYNVRYFWARFRYEMVRSKRYDQPLALLMIDLDKFKGFNEAYGHQMGDTVLRQVAAAMITVTREVDIVARYGGEEFVIVLPSTELEGAQRCAENLRKTIEAANVGNGEQALHITVSIGVAYLTPAMPMMRPFCTALTMPSARPNARVETGCASGTLPPLPGPDPPADIPPPPNIPPMMVAPRFLHFCSPCA